MSVTIKSYPDNEINYTFTTSNTDDSAEIIKYVWVDFSETTNDTYVEIAYNGVTKTYYIEDECKYIPYDVFFINKEGTQQSLTFFKERSDSLSVSNSEYESDSGQASLGFHQYKRYNIQGRESFKLSSGWIEESNNEAFTQLLLSEKVWVLEDDAFAPVNIESKSLEYKTQTKDRLISYEIDFKYSYNKINNI